ncbi:hypothetical protein GIB67_016686, partial [Kingdonia uniflora]
RILLIFLERFIYCKHGSWTKGVEIRANVDYTIDLLNVSEYRDNKIHTRWLDSRIAMQVRAESPP